MTRSADHDPATGAVMSNGNVGLASDLAMRIFALCQIDQVEIPTHDILEDLHRGVRRRSDID